MKTTVKGVILKQYPNNQHCPISLYQIHFNTLSENRRFFYSKQKATYTMMVFKELSLIIYIYSHFAYSFSGHNRVCLYI